MVEEVSKRKKRERDGGYMIAGVHRDEWRVTRTSRGRIARQPSSRGSFANTTNVDDTRTRASARARAAGRERECERRTSPLVRSLLRGTCT